MEDSTTKAKKLQNEPSDQPYVEVRQVDDDDSGAAGRQQPEDIEVGPVSGDDSAEEESKNARPPEPEDKPVVLGTRAQLWTSLVHLLPLVVSAVLITINIQRWYWFHENDRTAGFMFFAQDTNGVRNLLQFVAKVYELLVIASLGALTLKVFKRRLVESHLSLGLLTGAYRVSDVSYIFSRQFWTAIGEHGNCGFLMLLVFVNTILATLVGPASAVLLVPELDWYAFPNAFGNAEAPVFFYNSTIDQTWPRVLSGTEDQGGRLHNCTAFTGWFAEGCPSAGFADLYRWLTEWHTSGLTNDLVIQDPTGVVSRRLAATEDSLRSTVVMTTVSMPPLLTTSRLLNFIKWDYMGEAFQEYENPINFRLKASTESTIFQPLVQSQCSAYTRAGPSWQPYAFYRSGSLNCLGDPACEKMLEENELVGGRVDWNTTSVEMSAFIMAPNASQNRPLLAAATFPYRNGSSVGVLRFACTILAHWVPATLSVSPDDSTLVQSNVTDLVSNPDFSLEDSSTFSAGPAIRIEEEWAEKYLIPKVNVTGPRGTTEISPLRAIFEPLLMQDSVVLEDGTEVRVLAAAGDQSSDDSWENLSAMLRAKVYVQKAFTGIVTEGLARYASGVESYVVRSHNDTAIVVSNIGTEDQTRDLTVGVEFLDRLSTLIRFKFEAEKYGYGSGKVGPTLNFALSVIYIYLTVVGSYLLYAMVLSKLWLKSDIPTVRAWNDVTELLLLAWNSKSSPVLSRSNVGVHWSKWSVQVGIRADATGRAQLVTSDQGVEKLRRNELYH